MNTLSEEGVVPDEAALRGCLGDAYGAYLRILDLCEARGLESGWRYYRDVRSWLCRVTKGKHTIVWMSASEGLLRATVYIPERAAADFAGLDLEPAEKERFARARGARKAIPCTFDIRSPETPEGFATIMDFRIRHA